MPPKLGVYMELAWSRNLFLRPGLLAFAAGPIDHIYGGVNWMARRLVFSRDPDVLGTHVVICPKHGGLYVGLWRGGFQR